MQKPPLKQSLDDFFYVLSSEEFGEYVKFTECHIYLLKPQLKQHIIIKESELLKYSS